MVICSVCDCQQKNNTIICSNRNIQKNFPKEDWLALNDKIIPEVLRYNKIFFLIAFILIVDYFFSFDYNLFNFIEEIPFILVKTLNFSHNWIQCMEMNAFKNLKYIEHLDLSYNRISSSCSKMFMRPWGTFDRLNLVNLKIINLGNNIIQTIQDDTFEQIPNLETLILESNPLIDFSISAAISICSNLKVINRKSNAQ